ncbi:MAG: hypothetical protein ACRCV5_19155 [Afipia sp.]
MSSKVDLFNETLGMLLLQRRIVNTDTDTTNECKVLNTHFNTALKSVLEELDLDCTSTQKNLTIVKTDPNKLWKYAYRYPADCAFFRRIQSCATRDDRYTQIRKKIGTYNGDKVIFTDQYQAVGEYITTEIDIEVLPENAMLCVAAKLAILSAPLIVGKGAADLRSEIRKNYIMFRAAAQAADQQENFNFTDDEAESEFVTVRTS